MQEKQFQLQQQVCMYVIVEKDARTEILNFVTEINLLIQYFYSSEINGLPIQIVGKKM